MLQKCQEIIIYKYVSKLDLSNKTILNGPSASFATVLQNSYVRINRLIMRRYNHDYEAKR